jgi:glyoxylase I family protein
MEKITGIGGFFFRSRDPGALAQWYETHLGVTRVPKSYGGTPWTPEGGPCVFAPFPQNTEMFPAAQVWMINFRVRDLDAMAAQLRAAGRTVEIDPEVYPNGRFAQTSDPEGNPIQLWEPSGSAL